MRPARGPEAGADRTGAASEGQPDAERDGRHEEWVEAGDVVREIDALGVLNAGSAARTGMLAM